MTISRFPVVAVAAALVATGSARAADHAEAPGTLADPVADIADVYAWHEDDALVAIITFAGLQQPGAATPLDSGVAYTLHIDNDGDLVSDLQVRSRFVATTSGSPSIVIRGLPGAPRVVRGPVGGVTTFRGRPVAFAGVVDDPFFFDLQGFQETLATGTLSFDAARDFFAGLNVSAIALRMPLDDVLGSGSTVRVWATTSR